MTNWLVTGGCGFIGSALIRRLLERGDRVRVLDDLSTGSVDALREFGEVVNFVDGASLGSPPEAAIELAVGDVRDADLARRVAGGCEVIVHLAAQAGVEPSIMDPRRDLEINVLGTFNALEAARQNGVGRFVVASSSAAVGEVTPPIHEGCAGRPVAPYGAAKLSGEAYCSAYYKAFGIETVALRFGNVYGPGSVHKGSVVAKFIRRALDGEPLEIYGDGGQTRDFIYIDDLVQAILSAGESPDVGGEVFQIASSRETTVAELAEELAVALRRNGGAEVNVIRGETRIGDVRRSFADTRKALDRLGWKTETTLPVGLARTVEWFLERRKASPARVPGGAKPSNEAA